MEITAESKEEWNFEYKVEKKEMKPIVLAANSVARVVCISSIRLMGKEVGFSVDRRQHITIDPITMELLQLVLAYINPFEITVTRGKKIEGIKCYKAARIATQGVETEAYLLVVLLGEPYIILGTVWWKDLGPTLWDFSRVFLQFWGGGRSITLHEVLSTPVDMSGSDLLDKILQPKGLAYAMQLNPHF